MHFTIYRKQATSVFSVLVAMSLQISSLISIGFAQDEPTTNKWSVLTHEPRSHEYVDPRENRILNIQEPVLGGYGPGNGTYNYRIVQRLFARAQKELISSLEARGNEAFKTPLNAEPKNGYDVESLIEIIRNHILFVDEQLENPKQRIIHYRLQENSKDRHEIIVFQGLAEKHFAGTPPNGNGPRTLEHLVWIKELILTEIAHFAFELDSEYLSEKWSLYILAHAPPASADFSCGKQLETLLVKFRTPLKKKYSADSSIHEFNLYFSQPLKNFFSDLAAWYGDGLLFADTDYRTIILNPDTSMSNESTPLFRVAIESRVRFCVNREVAINRDANLYLSLGPFREFAHEGLPVMEFLEPVIRKLSLERLISRGTIEFDLGSALVHILPHPNGSVVAKFNRLPDYSQSPPKWPSDLRNILLNQSRKIEIAQRSTAQQERESENSHLEKLLRERDDVLWDYGQIFINGVR